MHRGIITGQETVSIAMWAHTDRQVWLLNPHKGRLSCWFRWNPIRVKKNVSLCRWLSIPLFSIQLLFFFLLFSIISSSAVFLSAYPSLFSCIRSFSFLSTDLNASLEILKSFWRHAIWTIGGSFSDWNNTNNNNLAFHHSSDLLLFMSIYLHSSRQKGLTTTYWFSFTILCQCNNCRFAFLSFKSVTWAYYLS